MIVSLLTSLFQAIISFVQSVFNAVFGNWNYGVLFSWLPGDIGATATSFILILFGIGLIKIVRDLLPL